MARMTAEQKAAAKAWNIAVDSQERYEASVFVEPVGLETRRAAVATATAACVRLGVFPASSSEES